MKSSVQRSPLDSPGKRHSSLRFAAGWLVVLAVALPLLAMGIDSLAAEAPVTIRLWDHHVHDKKFRRDIFKEFNKAHPDIKVEYTSQVSATYQSVLDAAFRSDTPPDIFIPMGAANLPKLIEMGWVVPLDDVAPSKEALGEWMARFPQSQKPFKNEVNVFGGKVYSWPVNGRSGWMMIFWNTKLFRDAGLKGADGGPAVPEYWEDVRSFAKKITDLGQGKVYGIVHGLKGDGSWEQDFGQSLAVVAGWPFRGFQPRTGRFDFKDPGLRGSIQLWLDMKADGSVFPGDLSMDDEQAKFKFAQDLAGMYFGGPWVPGGFLALNESLEYDTAFPPLPKKGQTRAYLPQGDLAAAEYVVSSKAKNRDAIWKVVDFMTSATYQEAWVKAGGGISVFPQYNKPEFFPHPAIAKIVQMGQIRQTGEPEDPSGGSKVRELFEPGHPNYVEITTGMWIGKLGWEAFDELEIRYNEAFDKALVEARKYGVNLTREDFTHPDWDPTKDYTPKAKK